MVFANEGFSPESTSVEKKNKTKQTDTFLVFLPLEPSRVSKRTQETVIYTRQIALPVMLQYVCMKSLYRYFSFNTPTLCPEEEIKERERDDVVESVKNKTKTSPTMKELMLWVKHPFRRRKKKRCEQHEGHKVGAVRLPQRPKNKEIKDRGWRGVSCSQGGAVDLRSDNWCETEPVNRGVPSPR